MFIGGKRSWQRIFCEPREEPKHWLEKEDCLLCRKQSKWNCWGVSHREVLKQSLQKHRHNEPLAPRGILTDEENHQPPLGQNGSLAEKLWLSEVFELEPQTAQGVDTAQ